MLIFDKVSQNEIVVKQCVAKSDKILLWNFSFIYQAFVAIDVDLLLFFQLTPIKQGIIEHKLFIAKHCLWES